MQRRRTSVENLLYELGNGGARGPVLAELGDLLCGGDFAGQKEPEEALWERLVAALCFGQESLALGDGLATEADSLIWRHSA